MCHTVSRHTVAHRHVIHTWGDNKSLQLKMFHISEYSGTAEHTIT